ncbi:hypothetical protein SAMN03080606_02598 [Alkaliphilus peptidifermentans DSM 18978]|uniref:Uncharacterized protein n=1 Tax=Alkaliphilus peptidifermentans DSM 18978 TaxID=1120976 RepID=A0A1G5J0I4_9FIRM|nr:hypothetical protein SAMN03080606_02598 [Alkaliphilus peptidifermentans DSM 18978]
MQKGFVFGLIAGIIFAFAFSLLITNGNIKKSLLITIVSVLCVLVQHGVRRVYNKE